MVWPFAFDREIKWTCVRDEVGEMNHVYGITWARRPGMHHVPLYAAYIGSPGPICKAVRQYASCIWILWARRPDMDHVPRYAANGLAGPICKAIRQYASCIWII